MDRPTGVDNPFARKTGWGRLGQQAVPITPDKRSLASSVHRAAPPSRRTGILTGSALPIGENLRTKARVSPGVLTGFALPPPPAEESAPIAPPITVTKQDVHASSQEAGAPLAIPQPLAHEAQGVRNLLMAAGVVVIVGAGLGAWLLMQSTALDPADIVETAQTAPVTAPVPAAAIIPQAVPVKPAIKPVSPPARRIATTPARAEPAPSEPPRLIIPPHAQVAPEPEVPKPVVIEPVAGEPAPQPTPAVPPPSDPDAPMATRTPGG